MAGQSKGPDPILLTLFANRFMTVAEAMGRHVFVHQLLGI